MTSPPSPALSEILSSYCSTADEGLDDCAHSEASSPELKRAKRHNMRTRLEYIFTSRLYPGSPTETSVEDASNSMHDYTSQISFKSADNDRREDVFNDCSPPGLGNAQNLCCSLPDMNLRANNECKGLDIDCSCCSHSISEPTEISLELRSDRRDKVVTSYYSHFKKIQQSKVESDDEDVAKENEAFVVNKAGTDGTSGICWKENVNLSGFHDSVAVILDDDEPFIPKSLQVETGVMTDRSLSPRVVAIDVGNQCDDDVVARPALSEMDEEDGANGIEIVSLNGTLSGDGNDGTEDFITRLPAQKGPTNVESNDNMMGTGQKRGSMNLDTSAGENTANIEALSPINPGYENSKASPARESFAASLNKAERIYENSTSENLSPEILEETKLPIESGLEISRDSKNDSGQFLGSRRVENEFKSELEFSTVLTLAYVRVRDLTNNIDKAQEYLTKIDKNDDEDDINELRYKIQAMFDSRASLSLEHAKWRSQFSTHFHQRKRVLASLKSRGCRTEQTYFQLRKELLDLEKEPIIPKRKRSLFSKIFSFRFLNK